MVQTEKGSKPKLPVTMVTNMFPWYNIIFLGKGLYRKARRTEYDWDPAVPFRYLNNEGRNAGGLYFHSKLYNFSDVISFHFFQCLKSLIHLALQMCGINVGPIK